MNLLLVLTSWILFYSWQPVKAHSSLLVLFIMQYLIFFYDIVWYSFDHMQGSSSDSFRGLYYRGSCPFFLFLGQRLCLSGSCHWSFISATVVLHEKLLWLNIWCFSRLNCESNILPIQVCENNNYLACMMNSMELWKKCCLNSVRALQFITVIIFQVKKDRNSSFCLFEGINIRQQMAYQQRT